MTDERVVGVSISNSLDLADRGWGPEHLNEMMVSVARTVLRLGRKDRRVSLAYGGDLRPGGFLSILFPLVRGEDPSLRDWNGRLISVLAWPYYLKLTRADEAELIYSCRFIRVTPADAGLASVDGTSRPADPDAQGARYAVSRCLSRMRSIMTSGEALAADGEAPRPLAARIIIGGLTAGYSGFMPGVFEEFLLAVDRGVPTYVVGAFGGIGDWLAGALLGDIPVDDQRFTLEDHLTQDKNTERGLAGLIGAYAQHEADGVKQPATYYDELRSVLAKASRDPSGTLRNGLEPDENRRLMRSEREAEILGLIDKGLRKVLQ